jgi:type II secretory pathway component PulC
MSKKGILMKHPFWLVNSTLLLFFFAALLFAFFSWQPTPIRVSFEPREELKPVKKELAKIDLSKIYTNDLFNTYVQPLPIPKEPDYTKPLPQPPMPKPPAIPATPPIKFLEPLKINLRGIIVATDERMNIAVIEDAKTTLAKNYKIGDMLEDAQLIRILKNKIILIRSNGQQETLYVTQHDAELEQLLLPINNWSSVIKKVSETKYNIDPELFVEKIRNLAQFIDALNLITVYRQGESIGCRVGKLENNSLGIALGLMQGDIIQSINNIPLTTTDNRFEIYKSILGMVPIGSFTAVILRKNQPLTITYTLNKIDALSEVETSTAIKPIIIKPDEKSPEQIEREQKKILEEKYRFAPTAEELQKKEKQDMLKMSQKNSRLRERKNRGVLLNNVNA